ncbi:helix-turn-helix transcriptional regulator [Acetobacter sp. TBRC 12305]|uniref:Helix-turn-helix transcriptional regulator n=1 Tax=Acetobacter garciniae TaxID=2817435 RepID=A0A939KRT0_9PROT|nr:helix-turn-helix domain-containing protein [Acetobacter garciniae]MBO1326081.1 helix-turn-helix transcriptional regulator [Acetobacter garciniae]MBX0345175.1 helix-turn-helix transcriptional regulator [Acetobacter garciniae]
MVTLEKPADSHAHGPAFNVYASECPARMVLDRVGDKWALLVLDRLRHDVVRFNALKRDIHGISQKVLSQVLKNLERDGLVSRQAFATVPVTVEYTLTPLGTTLTQAVAGLIHWAEKNMPAIQAAQAAYDAKHTP